MSTKHEYSQANWWVVVQYPEDVEQHPKCSCGKPLKVHVEESGGRGITYYRLYCEDESADKDSLQ